MKAFFCGSIIAALCASLPCPCCAEKFCGTLEKVDINTITLSSGDRKIIFRIDPAKRTLAAPFLGKAVTVEASLDQGDGKALDLKKAEAK